MLAAANPAMKVITPVRLKRKRVPDAAESTPAESTPAPESTPESTPDTGGLLRKSALRRFLKKEFAFPLQVRETFFAAMEAKVSEDLRRSVARARELKRSTLMAPDA